MRVLVLGAHADDETLGCGGTLLRHCARGDEVYWLLLTQAWEPRWTREVVERKAAQVRSVAAAYGMAGVRPLAFPAGALETVPIRELMHGIEGMLEETQPDIVYLVHGGDAHSDHRVAFLSVMSVLKPFRMARLGVGRVLCYETLSSTDAAGESSFAPNVYTDISGFLDRKIEIMALYETELQSEPGPRSLSAIRALARYRGATIAVEHAEAFVLVRELV